MSLLFDALNRAQESDAGAEHDSGQSNPAVPEAPNPPAVNPATTIHAQEVGMLAAQSIFSATARQSRRIVTLTIAGLAFLLLAAGAGFFYYRQAMASLASQPAIIPPPQAAVPAFPSQPPTDSQSLAPPDPAPAPPPAKSAVQETEKGTVAASATGPAAPGELPPAARTTPAPHPEDKMNMRLVPVVAGPGKGAESPVKKTRTPRRSSRQSPPGNQAKKDPTRPGDAAGASSGSHIQLSISDDPLREGYQALTEGRMDDAERLYREVLAKRPHERDALLGMAVIYHRKLQTERASDLYRQVLREDPGNSTATAALVGLSQQVDPVAAESRLKQLLDKQPTSPELHHALGRVLARQKRWSEAQQAFFRACSLEPGNAMYAYNLAVALDHLHEPAAALPFYEKSLQLLKPEEVALDRGAVQRRMQELRTSLSEQR